MTLSSVEIVLIIGICMIYGLEGVVWMLIRMAPFRPQRQATVVGRWMLAQLVLVAAGGYAVNQYAGFNSRAGTLYLSVVGLALAASLYRHIRVVMKNPLP